MSRPKAAVIHVDVQIAGVFSEIPSEERLANWASETLEQVSADAEVVIRVVDENESAQLNSRYRDKPGPTNVLSFPAEAPPGVEAALLGDIVVCAPVVAREAAEQAKEPEAHWAHMVVHGALHLLGHDHREKEEAEKMEALETRILGRLGYSNPYL
ncbi:MAG: rRNA maturation RNase YbeY [Gammaproteobacteria bacterium]|nr:rRNA maturation RNase YbeY [Gammaproteobacteria bacterium]